MKLNFARNRLKVAMLMENTHLIGCLLYCHGYDRNMFSKHQGTVMASRPSPSSSFDRVQSKVLTTEEILAAVLDSGDDSGEVEDSSSDDSTSFDEKTAEQSQDEREIFDDELEPCFKESKLISDVSSFVYIVQFFEDLLL